MTTIEKATELAHNLNLESEDGWTYSVKIVNADKNYASIEVRDEDGILVGTM